MSGYVAIQREIFEHPVFKPEPFTEVQAWLWMIAEAAWKPVRVRVGGEVVNLERGQIAHSVRYMAKAWQWEQTRVWRFLKKLRANDMIENAQENFAKNTTANATSMQHQTQRISICNYDKYQSPRNGNEEETATPNATAAQRDRNKEEPLNHLTKEIDTGAVAEVHREFLKVARSDVDDPKLWGSFHQIDGMLARGFTRQTILAGAAKAMQGKSQAPPWAYFAKCIESENAERAKPEVDREKPENLAQTAKRLSAEIVGFGPRPSLMGSGTNGPDVRLLSKGGGERS